MKKKILLLILLLVPFLVSAKEEISYELTKENSNGFLFLGEEDNQYLVYDVPNNGPRVTYYQPNGKKVSSEYVEPKEDFELMQKINEHNSRGSYINKVDDQVVELEVYKSAIGLYNEEKDAYEIVNYLDLSAKDQKKYTGKYHLLYELMAEKTPDIKYKFDVKDDCIVVYKTVYANNIRRYIEVYDFEENKLLSKKMLNDSYVVADANEYGIYVLEAYYDNKVIEELTKYDLKGKEEYTKDLTDLLDEDFDYNNLYNLYNLYPSALDIVNNGFIVSVSDNNCVTKEKRKLEIGYDPCLPVIRDRIDVNPIDLDPILEKGKESLKHPLAPGKIFPIALIKFDIDYEITTKTEGNGTVKVLSRSEAGNGVTFEVTPQEGYVLSVVKVTDANGNVIEFTDYKFTMPSSDVLIEAVFVPENPYTADIAIAGIVLVAIVFGVVALKYYKKTKWMN